MDKNIADLLELIKAHPELPIVPMVDSEIVCDEGYAAGWGPGARPASQSTWCRKSTSFSLTMKMLRPSSSK